MGTTVAFAPAPARYTGRCLAIDDLTFVPGGEPTHDRNLAAIFTGLKTTL